MTDPAALTDEEQADPRMLPMVTTGGPIAPADSPFGLPAPLTNEELAAERWRQFPPSTQEGVKLIYQSLIGAAINDGDGRRMYVWDALPYTQRVAMAWMLDGIKRRMAESVISALRSLGASA